MVIAVKNINIFLLKCSDRLPIIQVDKVLIGLNQTAITCDVYRITLDLKTVLVFCV